MQCFFSYEFCVVFKTRIGFSIASVCFLSQALWKTALRFFHMNLEGF